MNAHLALLLLGWAVSIVAAFFMGWKMARTSPTPACEPVGEKRAERIETPRRSGVPSDNMTLTPIVGACGVRGCPNQRPHSHALDLVRRLKETKR